MVKKRQNKEDFPPRSIRLSHEVWTALNDLRIFKNRMLTIDAVLNVMLDYIYLTSYEPRTVNPQDWKFGMWRAAKKTMDMQNDSYLKQFIEDNADKDGKVDAHTAIEAMKKFDPNPLKLPYTL